jgi:hypothetical protein
MNQIKLSAHKRFFAENHTSVLCELKKIAREQYPQLNIVDEHIVPEMDRGNDPLGIFYYFTFRQRA